MENKKIKILFGLPSFAAGGGIENQLSQQLLVYPKDKYDIDLITLFYLTDRPHLYERLPENVHYHVFKFKGYFDIKNYFLLYKKIRSIRPDIVITSMFPANSIFRIFKLFFGYKIITREHNTYTDKTFFHNLVERILEPLSDRIVAVSEGVADFFSNQTGIKREKVQVINNGINLSKILEIKQKLEGRENEIKIELGFKPEDKIILNVARLKPQKNHLLLLESFKLFSEKNPDYKLVVLGIGSEKEKLEKAVNDLSLEGKAFFPGYRDDVYKYYYISEMFALTSRIEGFPNVLLEAMAYGLPAVTTNVAGTKEMMMEGKNGYVVKDDAREIAVKMNVISENPGSYIKYCQETAEKFDIKNIVQQYEELILSLFDE